MAIRPEELEVADGDDKIAADALEKKIDEAIKRHVRQKGLDNTMQINLGGETMPNCIVKTEIRNRFRIAGWDITGFQYKGFCCYERNTELYMTITRR